ncbi:PAS domain-containing sensor histidine kinase [Cohnella abietis]|uniref:histidine kinase n=1 Tax=Cohnella abietis TaxID=2507935 RepID=A0A3T1CXY1_9BACL|nr:PAS domain-containing sensor histidine kinase [Cohnella abietis]BBI30615.1 hypothetical protein KCTCHS21_00140 [Cohnella abietis]
MLVLDSFLNLTSDAVYVMDVEGKILEVNKKFEELHGWTREEIIGKEMPLTPAERAEAVKVYERIVQGEEVEVIDAVKFTKGGTSFFTNVTISPVYNKTGELIALVVIERDITDRKKAEDRLRESEERYRVLVDCSPEPIVVYEDYIIVFVNPAAVRLVGATDPDQLIGQHIFRLIHPEDISALYEDLNRGCMLGKVTEGFERRMIRLDNQVIYVEFRAVPIIFQGAESVQLLFRDMTARKKAELKLEKREIEFSSMMKLSPEPVMLHQAGTVTFVNDMAIKLLKGNSIHDFIGQPIVSFFCPSCHSIILERMVAVVHIDGYMEFAEFKLKNLLGEFINVEISSICVYKDLDEPIVQLIIRDLTERKKTEEMIRRSDKLSVAGELAAGVAHEIRNPLTALKGFMQLLKEKNTDYVDIMLDEIDRISYIVNEFLGMAKHQVLNFVDCDLRDLIDSVIVFMTPQAMLFNVQMTFTACPIPRIQCEPNQIKQVFMNVLKNAIESMPRGGQIEISLYRMDNGNIMSRIVDQGVGIPAERMEKIGEPFFSLKEMGTGLGLMVCHRIIEAHKGKITIYSQVNRGTSLEIELPTVMR